MPEDSEIMAPPFNTSDHCPNRRTNNTNSRFRYTAIIDVVVHAATYNFGHKEVDEICSLRLGGLLRQIHAGATSEAFIRRNSIPPVISRKIQVRGGQKRRCTLFPLDL